MVSELPKFLTCLKLQKPIFLFNEDVDFEQQKTLVAEILFASHFKVLKFLPKVGEAYKNDNYFRGCFIAIDFGNFKLIKIKLFQVGL